MPLRQKRECTRVKPNKLLTADPKKVLKGSEDHLHRQPPQSCAGGAAAANYVALLLPYFPDDLPIPVAGDWRPQSAATG